MLRAGCCTAVSGGGACVVLSTGCADPVAALQLDSLAFSPSEAPARPKARPAATCDGVPLVVFGALCGAGTPLSFAMSSLDVRAEPPPENDPGREEASARFAGSLGTSEGKPWLGIVDDSEVNSA